MSDGTETEIPMNAHAIPKLGRLTAPSFHRPWLRYIDAVGGAEGGEGEQQQEQPKTFNQAEVDQIVKDRVARERAKYADYDDLKTKAEGARTLEDRVGSLETELTTARTEALRARIAAQFGVSTVKGKDGEPSDADLFLTGTDEATLTAQAQRLADRKSKTQNVAPREGDVKTTGKGDDELREFTRNLFDRATQQS